MPFRRYRKEYPPQKADDALSRNLDAIEFMSRSLEAAQILDGELLRDVSYTGTAVTVRHGLRRKWSGYFVVKRSATESVAAPDANNAESDKLQQITLTASGNVTFDLWVF